MLIMGGQWFALMLNVPVVGFRLWSLMQRNRMDITQLHSEKFAIKYANRLYGSIAFYCVLFVYFFSRW